jgi:hypothetical protein
MSFDLISSIANVGFPIAICVYFIVRFEKLLGRNTEALNHLAANILKLQYGRKR